jgi:hypothetical protein
VEATAASRKILIAQRDALVEQLNYLVQVRRLRCLDRRTTYIQVSPLCRCNKAARRTRTSS